MPSYNVIPFGYLYSFRLEAETEEDALKKLSDIFKEMGRTEEEIETLIVESTIENIKV